MTEETDGLTDLEREALEAADAAPPVDALEHAQKLAAEVNTLDQRIEKGNKLLLELNARRNQILGRELVELMDEKKLESLTVDGRTFKAENYYKASIPEAHRDEAHNWLEEHEAGSLIENQIVVTLPKDNEELARKIETELRNRFQEAIVERKRSVPWARLTSWLKDLSLSTAEDKVMPPLDIMGATIGRIVKIKEPKK